VGRWFPDLLSHLFPRTLFNMSRSFVLALFILYLLMSAFRDRDINLLPQRAQRKPVLAP
jgi:hypothetical protein